MYAPSVLACLAMLSCPAWAAYTLEDDYFAGNNFFGQFSFFTGNDPTHGFVQYQSQSSAQSMGLLSSSPFNAIMRVDSTNVQPNGRPSVRLTSNKSYSTGLVIIDLEHMPGGICGTWPAFWMLGPNWPNSGEIDIIEGVNQQTNNDMTLHTGPNCAVSDNGGFTGHFVDGTCASSFTSNNGCQIQATNANSYGAGFNANGGGVYATEITSSSINIWFFPRGSVPGDILSGWPNPSNWGTPLAKFGGSGCDIASNFHDLQLVFDTTFCGDWAGNVWAGSSCAAQAATCDTFVANNPSAFSGAYWSVNALKVYQDSSWNGFEGGSWGNSTIGKGPQAENDGKTGRPMAWSA